MIGGLYPILGLIGDLSSNVLEPVFFIYKMDTFSSSAKSARKTSCSFNFDTVV